ncbi:hypothetical protein EYF80_062177 [Liparis tanakae]|uniref:Uncharacterized protein n=1 Tax=Liparis tanakae TaxID=230148 RepID=A0A4Z2EFM4_9TELE|nr:hypothetical protein EYF80_062177 [Liparis tanakae]
MYNKRRAILDSGAFVLHNNVSKGVKAVGFRLEDKGPPGGRVHKSKHSQRNNHKHRRLRATRGSEAK